MKQCLLSEGYKNNLYLYTPHRQLLVQRFKSQATKPKAEAQTRITGPINLQSLCGSKQLQLVFSANIYSNVHPGQEIIDIGTG